MKRMTEEKAEQMLAFIADKFDANNLVHLENGVIKSV